MKSRPKISFNLKDTGIFNAEAEGYVQRQLWIKNESNFDIRKTTYFPTGLDILELEREGERLLELPYADETFKVVVKYEGLGSRASKQKICTCARLKFKVKGWKIIEVREHLTKWYNRRCKECTRKG